MAWETAVSLSVWVAPATVVIVVAKVKPTRSGLRAVPVRGRYGLIDGVLHREDYDEEHTGMDKQKALWRLFSSVAGRAW